MPGVGLIWAPYDNDDDDVGTYVYGFCFIWCQKNILLEKPIAVDCMLSKFRHECTPPAALTIIQNYMVYT